MSDVLIQSQNKSYVPRILEYYEKNVFCNVDARRPFPLFAQPDEGPNQSQSTPSSKSSSTSTALLHDRLGTSAVELSRGWRGGRGPGLVLIKGVTASPEEFMDWIRWRSPLPRAVARVYWLGRAESEGDGSGGEKREREPSADDDGTLATFTAPTSAELARRILSRLPSPPKTPVRVMAVPRSLQESLVDALFGAGWPLDVRVRAGGAAAAAAEASNSTTDGGGSGGGLFLVAAALDGLCEDLKRGPHDPPVPTPRYRAALVRPAAVLSDTTAQREVGARTCRAEWKLSEALAGLEEELAAAAAAAAATRRAAAAAIDVGASPGGWTRHLALSSAKFSRVVALDPADLDADVAALPNVTHLRMLSRSPGALEAVRDALRFGKGGGGEAEEEEEEEPPLATLLTCDANEPPPDAARCILPLVPLLAPGALVVLTLKMRYPGRDKAFATRAAMEQLGPAGLELVEALPTWLMANTMYERTLVLRRKRRDKD